MGRAFLWLMRRINSFQMFWSPLSIYLFMGSWINQFLSFVGRDCLPFNSVKLFPVYSDVSVFWIQRGLFTQTWQICRYLAPLIRHSRTPRQPILCAGQVTRHFSSIEFKSHGYCHSLIQHAMQIPLNICLLATKLAQYFFRNLCCVPFSDDIHAFFQLSLSQGRTQQMR